MVRKISFDNHKVRYANIIYHFVVRKVVKSRVLGSKLKYLIGFSMQKYIIK